jgi:hypothetical protein
METRSERSIPEIQEKMVAIAKEITESAKPEIEGRRDVCKTLISVSSAALVFTITFASNFIGIYSSPLLRYNLVICWAAFICSLGCSIASLAFAVELLNLPALVMIDTKKFEIAAMAQQSQHSIEPLVGAMQNLLDGIGRENNRSRRFFYASLVSFALALLILTFIGSYHLLCK